MEYWSLENLSDVEICDEDDKYYDLRLSNE